MQQKIVNWLVILLMILILGRYVSQTYARMLTNSSSSEGDQLAFLQLGLDMREDGVLTDGTRNPLYAAFLALIAHRDWSYFTYAKLLSMAFGVLAIIAVYLLGSRYFDRFTGLAAAYLLSINVEFIVHSATALTEALLVLTFILAWFGMVRALDEPDRPGYWALAGFMAGLAYQAKGSGQLLLFAFAAAAFFFYRGQLLRTKSFWLFLGCYALVASPLWIYNTGRFGSPTFNYAISHQMWLDSWNDWHPGKLDELPTFWSYLQSHSPAEMIERQWSGMRAMRNILVKALWPTRTLAVDRFLLSPISGYVLAALALLPLLFWRASRQYIRQNRSAIYLTGLTTFIFFMLFAWYDAIVAQGQRFLLPIVPFIFLLLAHIASRAGKKIMAQGLWPGRLMYAAAGLIIVLQLLWAVRTNVEPTRALLGQNLFERDRAYNADAATPLEWLVRQPAHGGVVAWGPAGESLPTWAYSDRLKFELYPPDVETIPELTRNLAGRGVDFIIVDPAMVSRHETLLEGQFPADGAGVELSDIPEGWALTYAFRDIPCDWCVFRLLESSPAQYTVNNYQIGEAIVLTGYDISKRELQPGDSLHLTLHWIAQAPVEQNYTVFTQLLGPDNQLHGQMDHQPIYNLWPTSRWQPGDRIADRYDILIDKNAPPGKYQILVGMYDPRSIERQPVTRHGQPLPDNAIRLTTITVMNDR